MQPTIAGLVGLLGLAVVAAAGGCRSGPAPGSELAADAGAHDGDAGGGVEVDGAGSAALAESAGAESAESALANGRVARGVESKASAWREDAGGDAGAGGAACEGVSLSLFGALFDARCAISAKTWSVAVTLSGAMPDAGERRLRQEARRDGDGIVFSLVNRSAARQVVPLRFRPGRAELPAFSVLAEDAAHAIFELAAPSPDLGANGNASANDDRVHTARIRLAPGGEASARLAIDRHVVKRLDRPCTDGGASACPMQLPKGRYVLYLGALLSGVDVGPPARVEWDAP